MVASVGLAILNFIAITIIVKNFADITCRKGLKNIRKQIKTKKHLEQMLVPLFFKGKAKTNSTCNNESSCLGGTVSSCKLPVFFFVVTSDCFHEYFLLPPRVIIIVFLEQRG